MCFPPRLSSGSVIFSFPFSAFGLILVPITSYDSMDVRKTKKLDFSRNFNFQLKITSDYTVFYTYVPVSATKGELCTRRTEGIVLSRF